MSSESVSGVREVGGTRRPDGTFRKVVKVREGFKSEELDKERRAYKSKGVLEAEALAPPAPVDQPSERALREREKRRRRAEAKRAAWLAAGGVAGQEPKDGADEEETTAGEEVPASLTKQLGVVTIGASSSAVASSSSISTAPSAAAAESKEVDPAKQVKALQKKLRQIEKLELDVQAGKVLSPEEQAKLDKKASIEEEIRRLS